MPLHAAALKYLDAVVRLGSIRRAADRLNVASSAINRHILKIEDELGVRLFERLPRGVRLTPAGELLVQHVRGVLRDFDVIRSDIEELKGLRKGNVIVAAVEGVADEFLPKVVASFHGRHPGITFTLNVLDPNQIIAALRSNSADVGLMFNPPPQGGVKRAASVALRMGAVMTPDHLLARRKRLRLKDCQAYPLILPDTVHPNRDWLNAIFALSAIRSQPVAISNSFQLMRELAKQRLGIAFQTTVGIEEELARGELVYIPLDERKLAASVLVALVRAKEGLPTAASAFLEEVRATFAAMR